MRVSSSVFISGRTTQIFGIDFKNVAGLDMKIVDFACDIKLKEIKLSEAQLELIPGLSARKKGAEAELADMTAKATSTLELHV